MSGHTVLHHLHRQHVLGSPAGSADSLDASEDTSSTALWRWELRDAKVLPKGLREEAAAMKKHMQRVSRPLDRCQYSLSPWSQGCDLLVIAVKASWDRSEGLMGPAGGGSNRLSQQSQAVFLCLAATAFP